MSRTSPFARVARAVAGPTLDRFIARQELADRTSATLKATLRSLQLGYSTLGARGEPLPRVWDVGFRVFSEGDEDGVIAFLLAVAGTGPQTFVDIGAGNGVHASNCANLAFNLGFDGLFVDASAERIAAGRAIYGRHPDTRRRPPQLVQAFVKTSTVNALIRDAGFEGELDVLSIDIDGNDYWIWEAIDCVRPRIVVIEVHDEYGLDDVLAPYDEDFVWQEGRLTGASASAMTALAERLGYRLVGGNRRGFNAMYVRNELAPALPTIDVAELLALGDERHRR